MFKKIKEFFRVLGELKYIIPLLKYKFPDPDDNESLAHSFEKTVEEFGNNNFIFFEDEIWSYSETNKAANSLAYKLIEDGVTHSDRVVLFMENRPDFIISILALNKIGAIGVLINTSLTGKPLIHCINSSDSKKCIVGAELAASLEAVLDEINIKDKEDIYWVEDGDRFTCPEWALSLKPLLDDSKDENLAITNMVTAKDTAFYIFTSGTTGVPKAALFPNSKIIAASINISKGGYRINDSDCMYNCLPLYHSTGLMLGLCACIQVGAATFIRRKFSASAFWKEAKQFNTTAFVYVGELCRYLSFQDSSEEEKDNPISSMVGNGLRPDLWDCFRNRFNVERIIEIYGASEGNALFMNLLNKDETIGMTNAHVALFEYDVAEDKLVRDTESKFIEVDEGQPGLLLVEIGPDAIYNGYTDKKASEEKVISNVFEEGDRWFNTGDLVKTMDVGFSLGRKHYQFVDRVGDTFRWKSENVSTNEVAEILNAFDQVNMANVFGVKVPQSEGRAGMVAFNCNLDDFKWDEFAEFVSIKLPSYAQPVFVRIIEELETTGTFKLKKNDLREEAYHLDKVKGDKVFIKKPGENKYSLLDEDYYNIIQDGEAGF
jgi:citronellyl-CoA synthetase